MTKFVLELAIKEEKGMLPEHAQLCELRAIQMKAYYEALIDAGFTEEQAFEIILCHGIDAGRESHIKTQE